MKKRNKIFHFIIIFIIIFIIVGSFVYKRLYPNETIEELLFYAKNGVANTDKSVFKNFMLKCIPMFLILYILGIGLFYNILFDNKIFLTLKLKKKTKKIQIYPIKFIIKHKRIFTIVLFIISIIIFCFNFGVFSAMKNKSTYSNFIEKNYIDPKNIKIEFPKNKKNLILIQVESFETTLLSKEHGGKWKYEIMPQLYELLNDNDSTFFYANKDSIGMNMITGSTFTTASLVTNSSGVPFKTQVVVEKNQSNKFIEGIYNLGDLLYDNGYYNEVISSATTSFGGLRNFYTDHGKYNIIDINTYRKNNLSISMRDKGSWGFNDKYMFDTAKKRLEIISKNNKPFNLSLITIDTHFPDGYVGYYSTKKFNEKYENVYATEAMLIADFVDYVKKQDYYKDTAIAIIGDHLSMQQYFFKNIKKSDRYIFNCFINSGYKNENKNKQYSAVDTYPTLVTSLGAKISGNKLGLGVNMFSDEKTIIDKYGLKYVNSELEKTSIFYNTKISKTSKIKSK